MKVLVKKEHKPGPQLPVLLEPSQICYYCDFSLSKPLFSSAGLPPPSLSSPLLAQFSTNHIYSKEANL